VNALKADGVRRVDAAEEEDESNSSSREEEEEEGEEADGGVTHNAQNTDNVQVVNLVKGI
jgi:hypothetical protein